MKTIEERAKEYAPAPFDPDEIIYTKKRYVVNVIRDAYIVGANAQKAIDIDKACEWLKENARDYACATIRCPYGEEEEIICDVHREIVEDFRKAMEEQIWKQ